MTLNKPDNEQCGNCYYCTSYIESRKVAVGFLKYENKEKEVYRCRRYPGSPIIVGNSIVGNYQEIRLTPRVVETSKVEWCGEWRTRNAGAP